MVEKTAESKFGSWTSTEARLTIEYPLELLDEIRLNVCSSVHTNPHGGVEVGGLLFGTHSDEVVRVAACRSIFCEHSKGFAFILSERDLVDLARSMEEAKTDPALRDLEIVGWFLSHTHNELTLTDSDLNVFDQCFPLPWQFTLVLRPEAASLTKAAFFVRDKNGKLCAHSANQEFAVEPLHGGRHAAARSIQAVQTSAHRVVESGVDRSDSVSVVQRRADRRSNERFADRPHEAPRFVRERSQRKKSRLRWLWSIPIIALLVFGAVLVKERYLTEPLPPPTFALQMQNTPEGQLRIEWDKEAKVIALASHGVLDILDGDKSQAQRLDSTQLRRGSLTYARVSGDVKVKLSVFRQNGEAAASEMAQVVGLPPAAPAGSDRLRAWDKERAGLQAEIQRLRSSLALEAAKNRQLLNQIRGLQNRLNSGPPGQK